MRYAKYANFQPRYQNRRAAILVDYENIFSTLEDKLDKRSHPDELIAEMLDELRRYLIEELRTPTNLTLAYADFSALNNNGAFIQRSIALQGIEPRFVPGSLQKNAVEIQLCTDAVDILHSREDITTFAIVTGDRSYIPLLQHMKRHGRSVLVVSPDNYRTAEQIAYAGEEVFIDALNLLSEPSRVLLLGESAAPATRHGITPREPRVDVVYREIVDAPARRTLEIIEEHFGQYEEVYLTPLLRKLSELLGDDEHDPKTIINDLEDAGAVWLEKRRGFPYDYTVLLVDSEHPDVQQIQQSFYLQQENEPVPYDEDYQDDYDYDGAFNQEEEGAYHSDGAQSEFGSEEDLPIPAKKSTGR